MKLIKLTKTNKRLPASTFYKLRRNVGTFCAILFSLFGSKFDYYQKMLNIKKILDDPQIQVIHKTYNINVCCHIMWAIICDGRFFFNKVKVSHNLVSGNWRDPSSLLLSLIMDKVKFCRSNSPSNFPTQMGHKQSTSARRMHTED